MNQRTAKRLRRQACIDGIGFQGGRVYLQGEGTKERLAQFGRKVISLIGFTQEVKASYPTSRSTIRNHPQSIRAVYQRLKKQWRRRQDTQEFPVLSGRQQRKRRSPKHWTRRVQMSH